MKKIFLPLLILLNGCMVGPDYQPPQPIVADTWVGCRHVPQPEPVSNWWCVFQDPLLNKYIAHAALYNNDILIAEANVFEARAQRRIAASLLYPHVGCDFNFFRARFSKYGLFTALSPFNNLPIQLPFLQPHLLQSIFTPFFDANWEIDLFGKTRRSIEAAQANYEGKMEAQKDILITVLGDVAKAYMNIRGYQKQKALTETNIALLEKIDAITKNRLKSGLDNALQKHNIAAELAELKSNLPALERNINLGIYSLSVLLGFTPESLLDEMLPMRPLPCPPEEIALGLRSDILRRRPDVREAEKALHAAIANIGVAEAQFFPSFSLLGFIGSQSNILRKLFDSQSTTWAISPNVSQPLFSGGRLTGNFWNAQGKAVEACQNYQKTVLLALQEAESAHTSFIKDRKATQLLKTSVKESRLTRDLTLKLYEGGRVDLKTLLDYDRLLISREMELTTSETATLIDLITLYKALGGGWQCAFTATFPSIP